MPATYEDGRVTDRIVNYGNFWEKDATQETDSQTENRVSNYTDVINGM